MNFLRPNPAVILREACAVIEQHAAAETAPAVLWLALGESAGDFAARCVTARERGGLVLAVIPHGFETVDGVRRVELPAKCFRLLHPARPARFRVLKGGRGSAKSWSIARVLIVTALTQPILVLACREIQKSIRDSVHRLLKDQVEALGLWRYFDVGLQTITSSAGAEFIFEGLFANTNKIKSLEGVTICWVEEAAKVSASSWEVLEPTIRKDGSHFLVNFNPEGKDDPTNEMFGDTPRPDAAVAHLTWLDNPWFPAVLERARVYLLNVDPDAHAHVWGGGCRLHSDAQILKGKYVVLDFRPEADWNGPYHGADFGFSQDPSTLVKCWVYERVLYIEYEAYGVGVDIDKTPKLYDDGVPGARAHTIRADSARPETISYLQRNGFPGMVSVEKGPGSVEDGVSHLRSYERIVIHPRCEHTLEEAKLYSFKVDRLTGDILPDIVDRHNHIWDGVRYALMPLIKQGGGAGIIEYTRALIAADPTAAAAYAAITGQALPGAPKEPRRDQWNNIIPDDAPGAPLHDSVDLRTPTSARALPFQQAGAVASDLWPK